MTKTISTTDKILKKRSGLGAIESGDLTTAALQAAYLIECRLSLQATVLYDELPLSDPAFVATLDSLACDIIPVGALELEKFSRLLLLGWGERGRRQSRRDVLALHRITATTDIAGMDAALTTEERERLVAARTWSAPEKVVLPDVWLLSRWRTRNGTQTQGRGDCREASAG